MFSKQFWVVDGPFEHSSPSRLQFSQNTSQRFTAPSVHVVIQLTRFTVVIHLFSFVDDSQTPRTTEPCCLYVRSEKLLQYSFGGFVDTRPIVRPRFRTHFADIPNSQLMYTVQLLQWNLNLTKSLGTGQICSLNGGFVISKTYRGHS